MVLLNDSGLIMFLQNLVRAIYYIIGSYDLCH